MSEAGMFTDKHLIFSNKTVSHNLKKKKKKPTVSPNLISGMFKCEKYIFI